MFRLETLDMNQSSISVKVKKFGNPTLEDQVMGRFHHTVTVADIAMTRKQKRRSLPSQFSYSCTCVAKKSKCIHIGVVASTCLPDTSIRPLIE
jgi:hypothetical protein